MQLTAISFHDCIYLAKLLIYGALDGSSATKSSHYTITTLNFILVPMVTSFSVLKNFPVAKKVSVNVTLFDGGVVKQVLNPRPTER